MVVMSSNLPDFSGQTIANGRYQLIEELGTGAYGSVYRALDVNSDPNDPSFYAIKCLSKEDLTPEQVAYQAREIAIHKMVSGLPHVLTLHEVVEEELYLYFVLELCMGGDLFNAITVHRAYYRNNALVKKAFVELLDGVYACHQMGVFHRDLKPENILCLKDGSGILLADFGLATRRRVCKDFGCGSSFYMSPECIGQQFDYPTYSASHSDIWSLGVILTNMISGRNPWKLATTVDDCFSSYLHNPDFLREMLPISKGANEILKRIFTLNPLSRISLPELRQRILELDTFFMDECELEEASDNVKTAEVSYATRIPVTKLVVHRVATDDTLNAEYDSGYSSSSSSDRHYPYESPSDNMAPTPVTIATFSRCSSRDIARVVVRSHRIENFIIGSDSGTGETSSGGESEGPITPETYPIDPVNSVPDLPEGESLDDSIFAVEMPAYSKEPMGLPSFLASAVQRLNLV
ncbi:hypothetical protein SERLA73DRAFT_177988 [Serpula lacrymans var. lacrymans S7.3]|uniref:non-specific serine/threonine protein kinase n=2 Tax=Serpula lacrymans var. lacrymans TaxID=341189 RepID=F8PQ81_SERL3|nr:serine/threonine protein kinase, negative regulator of sexual conjugation and meiosis [Serpula lacrymans var. lacrymans S7.9]EGO02182.1 hypothetical protein SERLA73DRAFT_177988 [Serpula lacrymans var. lacrymans S7.3]EGO27805.1 serine/threonine protein kinase, negative regulator of sexual conjugation and meiosis [Serpula lacrymans var. lacrymans S7.9]